MTTLSVLESIRQWLTQSGVPFVEKQHAPTLTSADRPLPAASRCKSAPRRWSSKAIDNYCLFVLPADRQLDSAAVKRHLGAKKIRFAAREELLELTGLVPGSVPPFGPPILPLPLVADPALLDNEKIAFNAGSLTNSIIMSSADYRRVAGAAWLSVCPGAVAGRTVGDSFRCFRTARRTHVWTTLVWTSIIKMAGRLGLRRSRYDPSFEAFS